MNTCEKCNREFEGEGKYCAECASVLEPTKLEDRKLSPKRFILIFCDFAIIAICLLVFLVPTFTDKNRNTSGSFELEAYLSDNTLYCVNLGDEKSEPVVLSEQLKADSYPDIDYSLDGTVVFFPSATADNGNFTLCYYDFKTNGPVTQIAEDVYYYAVTGDSSKVTYLQGSEENLTLHITDFTNDTVVADNVMLYEVLSTDGSKLCYTDNDGKKYVKNGEAEAVQVSEGGYVWHTSDDASATYIGIPTDEQELYFNLIKTDCDGNVTTVDENVQTLAQCYGSGELYYYKDNSTAGSDLYYYNGIEVQNVAQGIEEVFNVSFAGKTAAVVYPIKDKLYHSTGAAETIEIGKNGEYHNIMLNGAGSHIFYFSDDGEAAELYEINLAQGTEGVLIDKDVNFYAQCEIAPDNRILYAKNNNMKYDLYISGTLIAEAIDNWNFADDLSTGIIETYNEDGTSDSSAFLYDTTVPVIENAAYSYAEFENGMVIYYTVDLGGETDGVYKYSSKGDTVMIAPADSELY